MLSWSIEKGVISKLFFNGKNIIKPWGFETADSSAFYSLEDGFGYRYKELSKTTEDNCSSFKSQMICKMKEGMWDLNIYDEISNSTSIHRKVEATTLCDTYFMDFVMRFRFRSEYINEVMINDIIYKHNNTNVYYQYPVDEVTLKGDGFHIKISIVDKEFPPNMTPVIYVRDQKGEWVVHVRMIPKTWDKEVIKVCTRWAGTRPLPQFFSNIILSSKRMRKSLWYRGERKPFKNVLVRKFLNPAAFAMVKVPKDTELMWNVKCEIIKN